MGHGSTLPYNRETLEKLAKLMENRTSFKKVDVGFMSIYDRTIPSAIEEMARRGVDKILVVPVFISHGVHTLQDIPGILGLKEGESRTIHPLGNGKKVDILYCDPLGADERLLEILTERALTKMKHTPL